MRLVRLTFCALFLAFQLASPLYAQDLGKHLGRLADIVDLGTEDPWEMTLDGGWFNMINRTEGDAMRYYITDFPPLNGGSREVRVNLALTSYDTTPSFAGLVFDWKSNTEFAAFLIGSDGSVMALQRTESGFETHPAEEQFRARLDGSDIMEFRETPGKIDMILNGESVFVSDNEGGFVPNYGIVAFRKGRFAYTGFSVETQAGGAFPAPAGTAGGGQSPFPAPGGGGNGGTPQPAPAPAPASSPAPAGTPPAQAGGLSPDQELQVKAVLGTTLSVFLHEFAHALIGETGLPATGPEEDTADAFSAIMMAGAVAYGNPQGQADPANNWGEQMGEYGALFWYYSGLAQQNAAPASDAWQDEHAPDLKRFRNAFCLMYGMAPQYYGDIADRVGFNARSRARCQDDSAKQLNAWLQILATIQRSGGPGTPGAKPADAPGGAIRARFEDPGNSAAGQIIKYFMGDSGVLQGVLNVFQQMYVLPRDLNVSFENCQDLNAWYDPDAGKITLCYALFDLTAQTVIEGEKAAAGAGGTPPPATPAAGNGADMSDAERYLLGIWDGVIPINGVNYTAIAYYDTDKTYGLKFNSPYGEIVITGSFAAQIIGNATLQLTTTPVNWAPEQLCDTLGNCVPNTMTTETSDVSVIDENTVEVDGVRWSRRQ